MCHVCQKTNIAYYNKDFITAVKHSDDLGLFYSHSTLQSLSWPWTPMHTKIWVNLESNLRPFIWCIRLGPYWVKQIGNDPKLTLNSTTEYKKGKNKGAAMASHSPDLKLKETDLKSVVQKWMLTNLNELEQCCKEEWAKILTERFKRPLKSYRKHLLQVP